MSKLVSLEYLNDYNIEDLRKAVEQCFLTLNFKSKIKSNMKVLIKVCLPNATAKDNAETTHPSVVRAIVDILTKMNVKCVVADSPEGKYNEHFLNDVYLNTGMLEMANLTTCELNQNLKITELQVENGVKTKAITVLEVVNEVDLIINVGKLKFDENLGFLGATANIFGLIPGNMKSLIFNRFHSLGDFNDYVIDMYETLKDKIAINILDGIVSLEAGNTQRMLNCLAVSESAYALDACIFDILNIPYSNTLLKQASARSICKIDKPYKLVGEKIEKFKVQDFSIVEFDTYTEIKQPKGYFKTHQERVVIEPKKCKGCKICSKICPTNAILMKYDKNGELYAEVDYKKCIFCNKCVTACPYSVVKHKTPLAYKSLKREVQKYNIDTNK